MLSSKQVFISGIANSLEIGCKGTDKYGYRQIKIVFFLIMLSYLSRCRRIVATWFFFSLLMDDTFILPK